MEDNKPCDDIFEGLAELLINNGEIVHNLYRRSRAYEHGICDVHTVETWDVNYGGYVYLLKSHDGEFDSITRLRVESEDE